MGLKLEELVGKRLTEEQFDEAAGKKDACYHKVKARYDVWPSAYASGALVKCRKVGAANWGNKSKKESVNEAPKIDSRLRKGLTKIQDDSYKLLANYRTVPGIEKLVSAWMDGLHRSLKQLGIMKESVNESRQTAMFTNTFDKLLKKQTKGKQPTLKDLEKVYGIMRKRYKDLGLDNPKDESVYEKNKGKTLYGKDLVNYFVKRFKYSTRDATAVANKLKDVGFKVPKVLPFYESKKEDVYYESITKNGITEAHIYWESDGKPHGYTFAFVNELNEAEYQGRKVKLGKIMQGDTKKFKVYVKNPKGNVVKVNFGQGGSSASKTGGTMRIRKSNPDARKSFRARHNCDSPGPRHKARYWSCRKW